VSFSIDSFILSQLTLLNRFQQKPSPFKLIAFVGKLDQDSGARSDTLRVKGQNHQQGILVIEANPYG